MTFFSKAARLALAGIVLGTGACSLFNDSELYGYEDEFYVPEPDLIPVMSDDKPGRTVDEMLELTPSPVVVKRETALDLPQKDETYEHAGRFGSKEKISLRKGLNVPDTGIVYGKQKRKDADEVRSLALKQQDGKDIAGVPDDVV